MLANQEIWLEIIRIVPSVLWVLFALIALLLLQEPLFRYILPYVSPLRMENIEISLARFEQSMQQAFKIAAKNPQWEIHVSDEDTVQVIRRISRNHDLLQDSRILIFDDSPHTLINEIRMLSQLDIQVETVSSVDEALNRLANEHFDLLISDIARPQGQPNGIATLQTLLEHYPDLLTIFYIGSYYQSDGVPPAAFGITNRPDELMHLILDILERKRL